ncbi:MAG: urease accessory protein UreJ [marine bacterium B5-7]|nr:MAG: urease accessory protein UreJ [marine bacterium B5-7]
MRKFLLALAFLMYAPSVLAHHPLGGMPLVTFSHGFLSGIGHPVLGFDHLFFVVLVGVAAVFTQRKYLASAAYIVAMLAGCLVVSAGYKVPATELIVSLSLLVLGVIVLRGYGLPFVRAMAIFAGFGFFHGAAFAGFLADQEAGVSFTVLIGYLMGLGITQYGIAIMSAGLSAHFCKSDMPMDLRPRFAGAMVAGVGLFLLLEQLEEPLIRTIAG